MEKECQNFKEFYNSIENRNFSEFENEIVTLDKIPNENLREAYLNLQNYSLGLKSEKEALLKSLNQEVILNEEQRNCNEILKNLLENSIINNDLSNLLQTQK
jgi:hypothetical protein